MKVLFFEPYAISRPHFEEALELVQLHLNKDDYVTLYYCSGNLSFCEGNVDHKFWNCAECIGRRLEGISRLKYSKNRFKVSNFQLLFQEQIDFINHWNLKFSSIDELKKFEFEGIDLGMSVASSLISTIRDPEPELIKYQLLIDKLFKSALTVYFSFKNRFINEKFDVVYFFNGRFSNIRPLLRLCERNHFTYIIHERGANMFKYELFVNHLPHSTDAWQNKVLISWENEKDNQKKINTAVKFYVDKKKGVEYSWHSYVTDQNPEELPTEWNCNQRNIVIFNSSDDEYAAIKEFDLSIFGRQVDALKRIKEHFLHDDTIDIYLRMHPNLKNVQNFVTEEIKFLNGGNFRIILPSSTVSSYKLIECASVVVTFGSTTGIESTFWGKPSILVGNSFYKKLNVTYNPDNFEELFDLIRNVNEPKPLLGTYKYAFHLATFGIPFKYYEPIEIFKGKYMGKEIVINKFLSRILKYRFLREIFRFLYIKSPTYTLE